MSHILKHINSCSNYLDCFVEQSKSGSLSPIKTNIGRILNRIAAIENKTKGGIIAGDGDPVHDRQQTPNPRKAAES